MLRLIRFEFSKVLFYKTFWITLALYALVLLGAMNLSNISFNGVQAASRPVFFFWISGFIAQLFLGYLAILLICNEFENRNLRQHIIDGLGRGEVLVGKLLLFGFLVSASMGILAVLAVVASVSSGSEFNFGEVVSRLLNVAIRTSAYLSLALFIALLFRRASSSIAVFVGWSIIIEPLLGWVLKRNETDLYLWLPTEVFSGLLQSPFAITPEAAAGPTSGTYLATAGYIIAFWLASFVRLNKVAL